MNIRLNIISFCSVILFLSCISCGNDKGGSDLSDSNYQSDMTAPKELFVSGQKDLDLTNTTFTLSTCTGGVSFVSTAQSANSIKLPSPVGTSVTCNIALTQLAYTDASNSTYLLTPASTALTGTVTITTATGAVTATAPVTATGTYNGSGPASGLTAFVTYSIVSNQISITWNNNAPTNTATISSFSAPTAGLGGNAVPPTVTSGFLFNNSTAGTVAMILNFINNSGASDNSGASQNANTIYQAKTTNNSTAGPQCYLFYDQVNTVKPSWYNLSSSSTLTTATNFTAAQVNTGALYGYYQPTNYAAVDALFKNAQTTSVKAGITAIGSAAQVGYYITSGTVILSYFNCYNLINFAAGNWGGDCSA